MDDNVGARIEQWFLAYSSDIYRFLVYYTGRTDIDDLVQETFIRALKSPQQTEIANPKTWLFAIARNAAIDERRRKKLISLLPETFLQHLISRDKTPEESLELSENKRMLYDIINQLKPSYRDVLILRGIKGLSSKETAEILGWSEAKVNLTMHRAMKAVQSSRQVSVMEAMKNAVTR
ncbi:MULTISPECIES: RNA polymerase sigma factor [Brevibacillus]|uniref:RNA polymerase sigma factor n=1 Tax=Brevibacillus borstelensis AK1 TaxID=1300222 RepID=M8D668_9BACL|nr:RNA polymerase sigma factor [Brevibacillus borstelensis]EMT51764.1 RNA polymerase ECF-type sigma factor [Brevibacillus borstelensis AK1]KKX56152.1 RNA polymerase [Brevibacillus borstelensis cifa_chp40]MBE5394388.1 RNA polymerase sigma factor [Brevibacillus borstelensis]MCC0564033.1 RNA polymerase sigma factor [Brevibacillus borstelensis]MCM3470235.1 RNA polymerase sigma factor [Brevibacillus borstelensis]